MHSVLLIIWAILFGAGWGLFYSAKKHNQPADAATACFGISVIPALISLIF